MRRIALYLMCPALLAASGIDAAEPPDGAEAVELQPARKKWSEIAVRRKKKIALEQRDQAGAPPAEPVGAQRAAELTTVSYRVSDLVIASRDSAPADQQGQEVAVADLELIAQIIQRNVQPKTWDSADGNGTIAVCPEKNSLVIRQTQAVHEEIADLLGQLRRSIGVQATLEMRLLQVPETEIPDTLKVLEESGPVLQGIHAKRIVGKQRLREKSEEHPVIRVVGAHKLTTRDGQTFDLIDERRHAEGPDENSYGIKIRTEIVQNQKLVRIWLAAAVKDADLVLESSIPTAARDGETIVCDVTRLVEVYRRPAAAGRRGPLHAPAVRDVIRTLTPSSNGSRMLLVIAPRFPTEEEELLGVDLPQR